MKKFGYIKVEFESHAEGILDNKSLWYARGRSGISYMTFIRYACIAKHDFEIPEELYSGPVCGLISQTELRRSRNNHFELKSQKITLDYKLLYIEESGSERKNVSLEYIIGKNKIHNYPVLKFSYANLKQGQNYTPISNWMIRPLEKKYVPVPIDPKENLADMVKELINSGCSKECANGVVNSMNKCKNQHNRYALFCKSCLNLTFSTAS